LSAWESLMPGGRRSMDDALGVKDWIFNEAIAMKLVAIDFETADQSADSACAIGN
jgi:hypothetical protein